MRRFLFALIMLFCQSGWGQTLSQLTRNERLKVSLSKDDTSKIRDLNKLGNMHMYLFIQYKRPENRDSMFLIYAQAMRIADKLKENKAYWQSCVLNGIGEAECYKGDTINGKKKLLKAIAFFAQHQYVDEELNGWRILSKTAEYYGKPKDGIAYLQVMEGIALKNKKINTVVKIRERMIDFVGSLGKPDTIKDLYIKLVKDYQGSGAPDLDYAYRQLAHYYRYKGDLPKALYYALHAHDWMVKTNDTVNRKKSMFYGELAEIYQLLGQSAKSIEWYKNAIDVRRRENLAQILVYRAAGAMVQEYIKLKQARQGLAYITKLEKQYPPIDLIDQTTLWQIKAYCYQALADFNLAEHAYLEMMKGYNALKQADEIMLIARYDIGKFYIDYGLYKKAAIYIDRSMLGQPSPVRLKDTHYLLFKIDSANKNYVSAIKYFNRYKNLSDSIFNATKSKQIAELDIKYATDQKENDIRLLRKDRLLQIEKTRQADNTRNWILTAVVLLVILLGLLFHSFKINQKRAKEIDLKNISLNCLVAEKDTLLQEKEWLIKEVHHRVKNNLQIVMSLLQRQSSFIDIKEALAAIRNSEHRMHSIALIHQKLYQSDSFMVVNMIHYINEMVGYLEECFDLGGRISFEKQIDDIDLEINMAVPIGLILNEAITNAIKYACKIVKIAIYG
jgi:two-component sensor histidine kinase